MGIEDFTSALKMLTFIIFVSFMQAGPGRMMKRKVFHSGDYRVAWGGLERYFHANANDISVNKIRKIRWQDRQRDGQAVSVKYTADSPEQMADYVKEAANILAQNWSASPIFRPSIRLSILTLLFTIRRFAWPCPWIWMACTSRQRTKHQRPSWMGTVGWLQRR